MVGKVVRRLTEKDPRYFDVETATTYDPAVQTADPLLRRTLGLSGSLGGEVVSASATTDYPGLVVLPLAMYK